jgi:predicted GNAT family acetyltransferase
MAISFKHKEDGRKGIFIIMENDIPAGEMTYVWAGTNKFIIDHTEAYEEFSGKGYAKQLVLKGIDFAKEKGVKIIPLCPYAKKVMEKDETLHQWLFN